jgi:nicotinamide phosphoribosyltransferase
MKTNLILNTDSYKASHWLQYPPKTKRIFSYIESRGGEFSSTLFFGLQAFIKEYLLTPITKEDIFEAKHFFRGHGEPFNEGGWNYILEKHNGFLPLEIRSVPEGTVVPVGNVLVTVENTDEECFWLTSYIETALLRAIWYPTTVATISYSIRKLISSHLRRSGTPETIDFKLHDFGSRGVSSFESATLGGMAHLLNFKGSDTVSGILGARRYYNEEMAGFSIPAAEHSSITSWGKENEAKAYENMLDKFGGDGKMVAVVSDSYDLFNACKIWGTFRKRIEETNTTLIVRPDSGDPTATVLRTVKELEKVFGTYRNAKGYRVLNDNVRVIQGDGINERSISGILEALSIHGYSADNVAFGMGGALLQHMNRDTLKFAMKASAALIDMDDVWVDVFKDPVTDSGKRSKRGRVQLWKAGDTFETSITQPTQWNDKPWSPMLRTVFEDGKLLVDETFATVKGRVK